MVLSGMPRHGTLWLLSAAALVGAGSTRLPLPLDLLRTPAARGLLNPCVEALLEAAGSKGVLEHMAMATGKDLPFDAGKYSVCMNIGEALAERTKFFIVSFNFVVLGEVSMPGEIGVCLPAACRNQDFEVLRGLAASGNATAAGIARGLSFPRQYSGDGYPMPKDTVVYPNPFNDQENRASWGKGTTPAIVALALLVVFVLYCTLLELTQRTAVPAHMSRKLRIMRAFALFGPEGSWEALVKAEPCRPTDCLNGLRVVSMFFVILGHGVTQVLLVSGYDNVECIRKSPFCLEAVDTSPSVNLLLIGNGSVDTFFFISGFLLSFLGKTRSSPVILGTVLRYARLLPCLGCAMMIYVCIAPYLAVGPFAPRFQNDVFGNCHNHSWWSELLFISSFYPWMSSKACMGWSWYLGLDMVFFVVGLVLLNVWKKHPVAAWTLTAVLTSASLAVTVQQALHYNLQYSFFGSGEGDLMHYLYGRFYARIPVFLVGLVTPWAMRERSGQGAQNGDLPRPLRKTVAVAVSCLCAVAVMACGVFLPSLNNAGPGRFERARRQDNWTPWQNALWIALSRPVWGLCLLVIVLSCYYRYLPLLDAALAHRIWSPLTKLTYGAYLLHPVIIKLLAASAEKYYTFSYSRAIFRCMGVACLAYCSSVVLWCLVEKPMATLAGFMTPRRPTTKSSAARQPGAALLVAEHEEQAESGRGACGPRP